MISIDAQGSVLMHLLQSPGGLANWRERPGDVRTSLAQNIKKLSVYLIGWRGYFGFCQTPSVLRALDEWIR